MKRHVIIILTVLILISSMFTNQIFAVTAWHTLRDPEFEVIIEAENVFIRVTTTMIQKGECLTLFQDTLKREGNTFSANMDILIGDFWESDSRKDAILIDLGKLEKGQYKFVVNSYNGPKTFEFDFSLPLAKEENSKEIKVSIDNEYMDFENKPIITDGRVLIPLRSIFEKLGCTVEWDNSQNKISIKKDGIDIVLTPEIDEAIINNQIRKLDVPVRILSDRAYIPLRFVCESIGNRVDWNSYSREVQIYKDKKPGTLVGAKEKNNIIDSSDTSAINGKTLYFIGKNSWLYKINTDFSNLEVLRKDCYINIGIYNGFIYSHSTYNNESEPSINKEKLNSKDKRKLTSTKESRYNLTGNWLYYESKDELENYFCLRMSLDDINNSDVEYPHLIKLDKEWYTNGNSKTNNDTGKIEEIYNDEMDILDVDGEWIYFTSRRSKDRTHGCLYKIKTDGTYLTKINDSHTVDLITNGDWIYYTDSIENAYRLYKIKKDGTGKMMLNCIKSDYIHFAGFSGDWLFYRSSNTIYKTKIDGSETKVYQIEKS